MARIFVFLLLPSIAVGATENLRGAVSRSADHFSQQDPARTVYVHNSADDEVVIAKSCDERWNVAPGGNTSVTMTDPATTFWILPKNGHWNCTIPCNDCFYFHANITQAGVLQVSIGYGMDLPVVSNSSSELLANSSAFESNSSYDSNSTVVSGLDVVARSDDQSVTEGATCTQYSCDLGKIVQAGPEGLGIQILAPAHVQELDASWFAFHRGRWGRRTFVFHRGVGFRGGWIRRRHFRRCWWRFGLRRCGWVVGGW